MRKWLAIVLLVFLPLQFSWAAVASYCQHETGAAAKHFGHHAHQHKAADGKDTGTTHLIDGELDIAVEIDKTVKWDQAKLPVIWDRIAATGDDPRQYIEVKYSVSETRYKAWPDTLKEPFTPARRRWADY